MSSARGSDTAMKPSPQSAAGGSSRHSSTAPRRHSPMSAARSPRSANASRPGERAGQPVDPLYEAGRRSQGLVAAPGQRHGAALRPALAPGSPPRGQGNVSRSSNLSAPKHCSPSCSSDVAARTQRRRGGRPGGGDARSRRGGSGRTGEPALRRRRRDQRRGRRSAGSQLCDVIVEEGDRALDRIEENLAQHPVTGTPRWLSCSGDSIACRCRPVWWPSRPPTPCCSPGPSSRPGGRRTRPGPTVTTAPGCGWIVRATALTLTLTRPRSSQRARRADARRARRGADGGRRRPGHHAGRAARRGQGLLRRRRSRRVRHPGRIRRRRTSSASSAASGARSSASTSRR